RTHRSTAEPFFPDDLACLLIHNKHSATLGVEADVSGFHHGCGRAIVSSIDLPDDLAGIGIEGVELMRSVAATHKQHAVGIGWRRDGASAGHAHDPTLLSFGRLEANGRQFPARLRKLYLDCLIKVDFYLRRADGRI